MNNHHPTKVWRIKLVDCTIDQNRNDENIGKKPIPFRRLSTSGMKCTNNV